jgi:hypothetical protein
MEKVKIVFRNRVALVDKDMVNKMYKKETLVNQCLAFRELAKKEPELKDFYLKEEGKIATKIILLNRTIRKNVIFL